MKVLKAIWKFIKVSVKELVMGVKVILLLLAVGFIFGGGVAIGIQSGFDAIVLQVYEVGEE